MKKTDLKVNEFYISLSTDGEGSGDIKATQLGPMLSPEVVILTKDNMKMLLNSLPKGDIINHVQDFALRLKLTTTIRTYDQYLEMLQEEVNYITFANDCELLMKKPESEIPIV